MSKCATCNKTVTKKSPGIECLKCGKLVHCNAQCADLTAKQLTAVRSTNSLDWTCQDCMINTSKRGSLVIPEDETEEEEEELEAAMLDKMPIIKKLLKTVEKNIEKQLSAITHSMDFFGEKIDEFNECMEAFKEKIRDIEKKNAHLTNENSNLKTRLSAVEQRMQEFEQAKLCNHIEIAGIPYSDNEDPMAIAAVVASSLKVADISAKSAKWLGNRKSQNTNLLVELKEGQRDQWITKSKEVKLTLKDIQPTSLQKDPNEKIYVREALTPYNKSILWQAKQNLKPSYKYIWCKDGVVKVRKDEKTKVFILRNVDDIKKLLS